MNIFLNVAIMLLLMLVVGLAIGLGLAPDVPIQGKVVGCTMAVIFACVLIGGTWASD